MAKTTSPGSIAGHFCLTKFNLFSNTLISNKQLHEGPTQNEQNWSYPDRKGNYGRFFNYEVYVHNAASARLFRPVFELVPEIMHMPRLPTSFTKNKGATLFKNISNIKHMGPTRGLCNHSS